jgi:dTDP-4-dehydrorhamnose 3,5-epimerase
VNIVSLNIEANKEIPTVTSTGERLELKNLIHGVVVRPAVTQMDERGELAEIYSSTWGFDSEPVSYIYTMALRPDWVKGWVYHEKQTDRIFVLSGFAKYVLWDARPDSPTHGMVNEVCFSERNRGLISIPPYVVHALQNIGKVDAVFINMPTVPYNHASPDKYRVSPSSVPYNFSTHKGMCV